MSIHQQAQKLIYRRQQAIKLFAYLVVICSAVISSTTTASVLTLFGPQTFVRGSGSPVVVHAGFEAPIDGMACVIKVNNGGLEDETYDQVSSTIISLNGASIFSPNEFNQNVTYLEKPTILTLVNSLDVEVRGKPGGALSIRVDCEGYNAPTADDQIVTTLEDTAIEILLTGADIDGDAISYSIVTGPSHGALTGIAPNLTYTPSAFYNGTDSIVFVTNDGLFDSNAATVSIVVAAVNNSPTISSTPNTEAVENVAYHYALEASDVDLDDSTTFSLDAAPSGMTIDGTGGIITWLPSAGDIGTASVTARVTDSGGLFDVQTYQLTVLADYDGDGIADINDADLDGDGVEDTIDQCPNSPLGATVDATGCVPSQQDADADGIPDSDDLCPNTPIGEIADPSGCSDSQGGGPLPPDPSTVAPPVDPTVSTTLAASTAFLYTGTNPIQTGVAEGTILPYSAAVVRGKVLNRDSTPLSGVNIIVHAHEEFGQTRSRLDGEFDMAVNGGGILTVSYEKNGYLPVQRQVEVPWQDYSVLPDVVMIQLDPQVTTIDLSANSMQVAQGSLVTDSDGSRQATILFPAGVQAEMVAADGSTSPLSSLNVRVTEYTVGENGPQAMPASLPATSAYTYAVELSIDELINQGDTTVRFSKPLPFYVDNFLELPTGTVVPHGYYDRNEAIWIPERDGVVVELLSIDANGRAEIDIDGTGQPASQASLDEIGIDEEERIQIATVHQPGDTIWRVGVEHFSPHGLNFYQRLLNSARQLRNSVWYKRSKNLNDGSVDDPELLCGSIIESQNQVLGESIDVYGTPFNLNYRSDRVAGRKHNSLTIPLTNDTIPDDLERIDLTVTVAGRKFQQSYSPTPNQTADFVWDGSGIYFPELVGKQKARIELDYVFPSYYFFLNNQTQDEVFVNEVNDYSTFGMNISTEVVDDPNNTWPGSSAGKVMVSKYEEQLLSISGSWNALQQGLGGWTLDEHHYYDVNGGVLYKGDGSKASAGNSLLDVSTIIGKIGGNGNTVAMGDGGPAIDAQLYAGRGLAIASDGTIYFSDDQNGRIRKIDKNGIIDTVVEIDSPSWMDFGPGGDLYFVADNQIHRLNKEGVIEPIAGTGVGGDGATTGCATEGGDLGDLPGISTNKIDGCVALEFEMPAIEGLAVSNDGSIYFSSGWERQIYRIHTDGLVWLVAGNGEYGFNGDNISAREAQLTVPTSLVSARDGTIYFIDGNIRSLSVDGVINTVAGNGINDTSGDGGPAVDASIASPSALAIGPNDELYVFGAGFVRIVDIDGTIRTYAGTGAFEAVQENALAQGASLPSIQSMAVGPEGNLVLGASSYIYGLTKLQQKFSGENINIPSSNGKEVYEFDPYGKHLTTRSALTNAVIYEFRYSDNGYLESILDGDLNETVIERVSGSNEPIAIVSPDGLRTEISLNTSGYLAQVTNPSSGKHMLSYTGNGLLTSFEDPNGNISLMQYDSNGRLTHDQNAVGGSWTLSQLGSSKIQMTSALGRTKNYGLHTIGNGINVGTDLSKAKSGEQRWITFPDKPRYIKNKYNDGVTFELFPDESEVVNVSVPDPRFGQHSPFDKTTITTTQLDLIKRVDREKEILSGTDLILKNTTVVNGRLYQSIFRNLEKSILSTSPEGRTTETLVDEQMRMRRINTPGLAPAQTDYDSKGRISKISIGSTQPRFAQLSYDYNGYLNQISDSAGRTKLFEYDLVGRLIGETLSDGRRIEYSYDPSGNLLSITPAGRPAHIFNYTAVNQQSEYTPPVVGAGNYATQYYYNLDKQLIQETHSDGKTIDYQYDIGGRLGSITIPRGTFNMAYSSSTGNLASIESPDSGLLNYSYDSFLPMSESWSNSVTGNVTRVYDNNFWVTELAVNGDGINYQYDNDGFVTQAGDLSLIYSTDNGLLMAVDLDGVDTSYSYNEYSEVQSTNVSLASTNLFSAAYTRDIIGRITEKTEITGAGTVANQYVYDQTDRLVEVKQGATTVSSYIYDTNGNRIGGFNDQGTIAASYDAQDRLINYNGTNYAHNNHGDLISKTTAGLTTQYVYDALGNLTQVTLPGGLQVDYLIDGRNRRIGKKVGGVPTQGFLYQDQLNPIAELDNNNNVVSRFVYASKANVPDYMIKGGKTYRIASDHLGSPRLVIDVTDGTIVQQLEYDEFGRIMNDTNPGFQPFGFAGGLYDQHTELTRFGARDYDAQTGRWTTKDPIGLKGGVNTYGYAIQNPVMYTDRDGENPVAIVMSVGLAMGAYAIYNVATEFADFMNNFNDKLEALESPKPDMEVNPETGRPNVLDKLDQSKKNFFETSEDIKEVVEAGLEAKLGPDSLLRKAELFCPLN